MAVSRVPGWRTVGVRVATVLDLVASTYGGELDATILGLGQPGCPPLVGEALEVAWAQVWVAFGLPEWLT